MEEKQNLQTDGELVNAVLSGNIRAFDVLVERYFGMVSMIAYARFHHKETAEDLAQEVFLRAYLHLGTLAPPSRFPAWISSITRNLSHNWLRKRRRASKLVKMVSLDELREDRIVTKGEGVTKMEAKEQNQALLKALKKLSPNLMEIVLLYYGENLSKKEIARRLEIHPSTVGRYLEKALNKMKVSLEPLLRESARTLRPSRSSISRTIAIISALAVMSTTQKSVIAAAAGTGATLVAEVVSKKSMLAVFGTVITPFKNFLLVLITLCNNILSTLLIAFKNILSILFIVFKSILSALSGMVWKAKGVVAAGAVVAAVAVGAVVYHDMEQEKREVNLAEERSATPTVVARSTVRQSRTVVRRPAVRPTPSIDARLKVLAKKAGVTASIYERGRGEVKVQVEWKGGIATKGGDFIQMLYREGVIYNFEQIGKGLVTFDKNREMHHVQYYSLKI